MMNEDQLKRSAIIKKICFLGVVLELNCPSSQHIINNIIKECILLHYRVALTGFLCGLFFFFLVWSIP